MIILQVTSNHNDKIVELLKLDRKKVRDETGTFVVEGPHLVAEAVAAGRCLRIFAVADPGYLGIETVLVTETVMKRISQTFTPQGILAVVSRFAPGIPGRRVLLLDGIQDPGNMGTLLRSALAFGFTTVVAEACVDYYNSKTLRATQGAVFRLSLIEAGLSGFLAENADYVVYGTDPHGGIPLDALAPAGDRIALMLGNEGAGIRPELLARTTANVRIESADVESLNVAIAGAIIMHRLRA